MANRRRAWAAAVVSVAVGVLAPAWPAGSTAPPVPGTPDQVTALVAASVDIHRLTSAQLSSLHNVVWESAESVEKIPTTGCETATQCVYGDKDSKETVVMFGDSHVEMWLPPVIEMAKALKFKIVLLGHMGCPVISMKLTGFFANCEAVTNQALAVIKKLKPYSVILSNRTSWAQSVTDEQWQQALETTITQIQTTGAKVVLIGDIQVFDDDVLACLAANPAKVQKCSMPNPDAAVPDHTSAEQAAAAATSTPYIDPNPWLCTATTCSPIIGTFFVYWDAFHITVPYAQYLRTVLQDALGDSIPG